MQATHLKRWSLGDMIRTDIFRRGVPWMLLMKRSAVAELDLNVSRSQRACVAATGLGGLGLLAAPWAPILGIVALASLVAIVGLNLGFYRFLRRTKGLRFAAAAVLPHLIYFACCGASVVIALAIWHLTPRRRRDEAGSVLGRRLDPGMASGVTTAPAPHHDLKPARPSPVDRRSRS